MAFYGEIVQPDPTGNQKIDMSGNGHFRGTRLASIPHRIMAIAVDLGLAWLIYKILDWIVPDSWRTLNGLAEFMGYWLALSFAAFNLIWLQSKTGQSIGKMLFGLIVVHSFVDPHDMARQFYAYPSVWMMTGRTILHYCLDLFFLVGLLFMAKSWRRESIADWCCNTLVLRPADLNEVTIHRGLTGARDR